MQKTKYKIKKIKKKQTQAKSKLNYSKEIIKRNLFLETKKKKQQNISTKRIYLYKSSLS